MSALQDIVGRQGGLLDKAQQRGEADQSFPDARGLSLPRRPFLAPQTEADQKNDAAARGTEQKVQQALRRALGELMQQYGDLTGQVPPNLGDADGDMRDATQALANAEDGAAAQAEQKAIEALQKGGRSMSQQMAQQFGRSGQDQGDDGDDGDQDGQGDMAGSQPGGNQPGGDQFGGDQYGPGRDGRPWGRGRQVDRRADERRDPLGRPLKEGTSGADESADVQVPDQMEAARTRAIQEELRRREADRTRPQPELDYIDRLLQQF
jgi:hypothetical protein